MDIKDMFDQLSDTVKDANIPLVFGLINDGEVNALVAGNGKELSIIIASMIQNISKNTGIPASIIMCGILKFLKMDEGSEETDG